MASVTLITDNREQLPLEFPGHVDCDTRTETLETGDYSATYEAGLGLMVDTVFERKSIGDLFSSYSHNYEAEKAKILRAKEKKLRFILAVEGTIRDVLTGHMFKKHGKWQKVGKDGISQLRQLISMSQKYDFDVMYFQDRREMALFIQEFYVAPLRWKVGAR